MWHFGPLIGSLLDGVCASSPWEAQLGREEFGGQIHAFAAAYSDADIHKLVTLCDEIDFNSFAQWQQYKDLCSDLMCGLRINPQCSTQDHAIYDPCAPFSRLGITGDQFGGQDLSGISGLHFHTLCEQHADALEMTLKAVEEKFGKWLPQMQWVNFGGGHHITRSDYDRSLLCRLIRDFKAKYGVEVYIEPGEAIALDCGVLLATVLDVVHNGMDIAVLDISCTAHMPDVLEMPYRPEICRFKGDYFPAADQRAGQGGENTHTYRLAGLSCLAGDVIGDYSFDQPLQPGDQLIFEDMAHYSMVKTSFFNGVQHPDIVACDTSTGEFNVVRQFDYADFKTRLS